MTRAALCARIQTLRDTLDLMRDVEVMTGGTSFKSRGAVKVEMIQLEADLRAIDRASGLLPTGPQYGYAERTK